MPPTFFRFIFWFICYISYHERYILFYFFLFPSEEKVVCIYLFLECIWVSSLWPDVPLRVKKSKMADLKWERNEWKIFRFHRQCPAWPTTLSWLDMITIKTVSTFFNFYWNCTVYCAKHPYLKVNPKCLVIDIWWWL